MPSTLLPGFADVVVTVGGAASNTQSFLVIPVITAVSPLGHAPVGAPVTVTGTSFGDVQSSGSSVTFNGVSATPSVWSQTSITFPVPVGATSGPIVVTVNGWATNGAPYNVSPTIDNIAPVSGTVDSAVTLTGSGFGNAQNFNPVTFGGVNATPSSWSDTSITVPVPPGAATGPVIVTVNTVVSNAVNFTVISVPPPVISSLGPSAGAVGAAVTISGSNLGATQNGGTVTFNGLPAPINSWSDSSISASVPPGVHSGPVVVTTIGGASNGVQFTFAPGVRFSMQSLYVTPDEINLEVGGSSTFKVVDASGHAVTDATWTVDSTDLATIAADAPSSPTATLQALLPGEVTVTATSSLGSAQAKATIFGAGLMPAGTPAWTFYPQTQDNFFDFKLKSRRNNDADPFLYLPEDTVNFMQLSALDEQGLLVWRAALNPLDPTDTFSFAVGAAGANDGGALVMSLEAGGPNDPFDALYRFAADGTPLWTYRLPTVSTADPAIGPDGTVYLWSEGDITSNLIALDDATGTEKFRFTPTGGSGNFTSSEQPGTVNPDGTIVSATNPWRPCADFFAPGTFNPPRPGPGSTVSFGSVIGTDASAYLMSTVEFFSFNYDTCQIQRVGTDPVTGAPTYRITSMSGQLQYSRSVRLLRVAGSGASAAAPVGNVSYSGQAGFGPGPFNTTQWSFNNGASQLPSINFDRVVPDADGGALISWTQQSSTLGSSPQTSLTKVLNDLPVSTFPLTATGDMATNDQGTVFFDGFGDSITAVDIASGATKWTVPGQLIAATDDGGVLLQRTDLSIQYVDAAGNAAPDVLAAQGLATYLAEGQFQVDGPLGSVTGVQTDSSKLTQLVAGPFPVPQLGTPASQKQAIGVNLQEVAQQGIVPNGVVETAGCTGFDRGQARTDLAALMAPIGTTEMLPDANGNLVATSTPVSNVIKMKNNTGHTITLSPHIPPQGSDPADPQIKLTIDPPTLLANGQYQQITFTGIVATDNARPVRIEAFDNSTGQNLGDILQVDVKPWHRWFIDYYAVSELNNHLQPSPPAQATLQAELDKIFRPQANLGFALKNVGTVADHYDVSPSDSKLHVSFKLDSSGHRSQELCMLGWSTLGGTTDSTCTDDTELTPMYHRLIDSQRQAKQNQPIDLDNPDMFYLLFFSEFDNDTIGGWSSTSLDMRRLPSAVHTNFTPDLPAPLDHDRFISVAAAHEIGHKLGQAFHHQLSEPNGATYLLVRTLKTDLDTVTKEGPDKKYPCRLSQSDWNHVNYVYPTPR